jgi:Tol biopolymer transport system component
MPGPKRIGGRVVHGLSASLAGADWRRCSESPGTAFDFGPDGLVFDPPATIIIEYDEAAVVAAGLQEEQLAVFLLDGPLALASVVDADANTVSADVAHFSTYFIGAAFADLGVSAFYEPSTPARVGEAIQFGADVQNLGPAPVTGATFTWVAFGDVTLAGVFGFCTEIADPIVGDVAVSCAVDALDPGQTDGIPVLRITPRSVGTVEIWGSVGAPTGAVDPIGENDRVSATIDVAPAVVADLATTQLYEPTDPLKVGIAVQYGADVSNAGPDQVANAAFTWVAFGDVMLEEVFGACTEVADAVIGDVVVQCPIASLAVGGTTGLPVLRITPRSTGEVTVWGTVTAPAGALDPDLTNNRLTASGSVQPAVVADLAVTQWLEPEEPYKVGTPLEFGADVSNLGPDTVTGAVFTWVAFGDVTLDGVFGFCTAIADPVFGDVVVQCPVDDLGAGQIDGIPVLRVTPQSVGEVTVWGTVTAPAGAVDPDADNNRRTTTLDAGPAIVGDLTVSQLWLSSGTAAVGEALEYAADVQNLGPDAVSGATFTWVAFGDVALGGVFGFCTEIANPIFGDVAVACPVDPLEQGQTDGIPVLRITPLSAGEVTIWATVTAPSGVLDPDADNNRRTTIIDVGPAIVADLTVSQLWLSSGTAAVGEALEFAADVQNLGPDAVSGATFTWVAFGDVALGGVFGFCAEIANPIFGDVAVACPVDPLEQGQTDGIPVLRIIPQSAGEVTIWATVTVPSGALDPDADNNRRTLVTAVDEEAAPFLGRVVFTSDRDGQRDLYIRDLATGGVTRLTNDPAVEMAPAWSPDGTRIAYHKAVNIAGDQLDVFVIDADGTDETRLTSTLRAQSPTWSPDGQEIAYSDLVDGNWEIMALNLDTGSRRRLTFNPAADIEPTWSGSTIAFVRGPDATSTLTSVVTISSVDGSGETVVATSTRLPELSPDGTRLTFMRPGSRGTDVVVLDLASGTSRVVATGFSNTTPAFSPDGDHVIFAKNDPNAGTNLHDLWIVAADGSGSPYIADNSTGDDYYPDWR